jgi:hypothetical protein
MLEHHRDIRPRLRADRAIHDNLTAIARNETVDNPQQRHLAAAARPENAQAFIGPDFEVDILERHHIAAAVGLGEVSFE